MNQTDNQESQSAPSQGNLLKGALLALVTAAVVTVLFVLPAEFGVDPTGIGVAKVTRVPLGTVKSRLFRARHALRRKLSGYAVAMGYIKQPALAEAC